MDRYFDSATALDTAMTLMVEQGDTLLAAAISHPLYLARSKSRRSRDIQSDDVAGDESVAVAIVAQAGGDTAQDSVG